MKTISFVIQKSNKKTEINGVLVQFNNFETTINFEEKLSNKVELVYKLNIKEPIENMGNFIASFVQKIAPNTYENVIINNSETKILHTKDTEPKKNVKTFYQVKNHVFDNIENQFVVDANGNSIPLSEIITAKKLELPVNKHYSNNHLINEILHDNQIPADVDRNFVRVLNNALYRIEKSVVDANSDIRILISKYSKKRFNVVSENYKNKSNSQLVLDIKLSYFV